MENYGDVLDDAIKDIMEIYKCEDPLEALIMYCKDFEWDEWFKFNQSGGTKEEFDKYMEAKYRKIEFERMKDPEKSMAFNKVNVLIKEYFSDY